MKPLKLTALLLLFPLLFFGQQLTGLWTGIMTNDSNTIRKDVSLEIALTEYRGKVYGYSRSEFIINDTLYYIVKRVKGTIIGDVCEVKDNEIVSYTFHGRLDKGVKVVYTFRKNKQDSSWFLVGGWKTTSTKKYYSLTGKTDLKEEKDLASSKLFPHLEELNLAKDVAFYKEQKRLKEVAVQTSKPADADLAKNLIQSKSDLIIKNKTSLTSLENTEEKKNEPAEEAIRFIPRTKESLVSAIQSESKTASLASNKTIDSKKPIITEPGKPFIEKKEVTVSFVQTEPTKTNTSVLVVQPEIKKTTPSANNVAEIKKNEPVIVSNNISTTKKETNTNSVQPETKKIEPPATASLPDFKKTIAPINNISDNKKTDPAFSTAATFAAERKSEKTQTIFFKTDSLELVLYDNGEIDGDTVSVLLNGEVIIAKQCLKAVAFKKTIYIPQNSNDSTVLVLYAENLGKYPPNTGLLIVHDGDDSYQVRFSADLQTNAAVLLQRKKQ